MINETGRNLSVLIITEPEKDWQTFATWYSFYKNLPEAKVSIVCQRNGQTPFKFFQWAKRLKVPCITKSPHDPDSEYANWLSALNSTMNSVEKVLVVKPLIMALSVLDSKTLNRFNKPFSWIDENGWFLHKPDAAMLINDFYLGGRCLEKSDEKMIFQANIEKNLACLVSYDKGCGRWINTSKGCPFSSAAGLVSAEMTINENRIIELWKKMVPLFDATV